MSSGEDTRTFTAEASALAFPLGGIGTGNVSLGARGDLRDWEIFNHAGKGTLFPNTFFALRAQAGNQAAVTKILEGPVQPPHTLSHGYHPVTTAGLPRFRTSTLRGEYPFVTIDLEDPDMPVAVRLEAFTPLLPLNPEDSGLPCAILTYTVTNLSDQPAALTIAGSLINPVGGVALDRFSNLAAGGTGQNVNDVRDEAGIRGLFLHSQQFTPDQIQFGDMTLATTHDDITVKPVWLRAGWFDFLREFWTDFSSDGRLEDLRYDTPSETGKTDTGSLGLVDTLAPGASGSYRFILAWWFPNRIDSWSKQDAPLTRNHYATLFASSWAVATYIAEHYGRLEGETRRFRDALFSSTLPSYVLDAVSANIMPLRSTTCFWMEDGRFFGWEGCFDDAGCCEGSCTHVWSYAQTVAFLFPSLEREMRRIEFVVETEVDGWMAFRSLKTMGESFLWHWGDQKPEAAVDGQMGSILRVLREWQLSGDREWLDLVWPGVKRAIDFASAHWDGDGDSVLDGRQHNTYDIEFYGPNPLCGIYYLAALLAVEELAGVTGETGLARKCRETFERGSRNLDQQLWNGEFFVQRLDDVDAHKYQHGLGCLSDQLLGELHARLLGLGETVPREHTKSALQAVYKHNFKRDFTNHVNTQRTYILNGEAGLTLCSWPDGGEPTFPFPYSDEVWTGIEYQVAAHLIYEGAPAEGLAIVRAVRERHDGVRRNPWNEVECGHHYARSMSSWAVLLALSGMHANVPRGELSFEPVLEASTHADSFTSFWSCGRGWGTYTQRRDAAGGAWQPSVEVLGGDLSGFRVKACGQEWTL